MLLLAEVRKWEEYKPRIYKIKNILYTCKQKCSMTVDVHMLISCIKIAYKQIFLIMNKYLYFKTEKDSKCSPTFVNYCKILFSTHFLSQSKFLPLFKRRHVYDFYLCTNRECVQWTNFILFYQQIYVTLRCYGFSIEFYL